MFLTAVNHSVRNAYAVQKERGGLSLSCGIGRMDIRVVFQTQTRPLLSTMTFLFTVQGPRSKALLRNRYFDIILRRKSQNTSINLFTLRSAYRNGYLFRGDFGSVFLDLLERIVTALI